MIPGQCDREAELVDAIIGGQFADEVPAEWRSHVAACAGCAEIAAIAPVLRADFVDACRDAHVPGAGQVWWRAAVRARLDTAETASRPMTWLQGLVGAGAAGLLVALIGMAWPAMTDSVAWLGGMVLPRGADAVSTQLLPALVRQAMPLLIVVALCLVIAPIAVYFATSDE